MTILTKEHRASMREILDTKSDSYEDVLISIWSLIELLDTIDALEASHEALLKVHAVNNKIIGESEALLEAHLAEPCNFKNAIPDAIRDLIESDRDLDTLIDRIAEIAGPDHHSYMAALDSLAGDRARVGVLEAERKELLEVLERFKLEGDDEEDIPGIVGNLWLAYEGARHNMGKFRKRLADAESERDCLKRMFEIEVVVTAREVARANVLEAERDDLRKKLDRAAPTFVTMDSYAAQANAGAIDAIEEIAEANHDTTTIGGAHAALREILEVIEGVDDAR